MQGGAFQQAVDEMTRNVAHDGGEQRSGDYVVGYAVEEAEGVYVDRNGELAWQEPTDENVHVEIVVRDASDGRFLPGLSVHATLVGPDGDEIGTELQPFLWHPWLYHYGRNWHVPGDGAYTLKVRVDAPTFGRHDRRNGKRYVEPAEVEFARVQIKTGQK